MNQDKVHWHDVVDMVVTLSEVDIELLFGILGVLQTNQCGTHWCTWLRHCTTSHVIVGSIPDGIIGIFQLIISSSHTMALGLTQPPKEISAQGISWD
jgi:hypothetical protein